VVYGGPAVARHGYPNGLESEVVRAARAAPEKKAGDVRFEKPQGADVDFSKAHPREGRRAHVSRSATSLAGLAN